MRIRRIEVEGDCITKDRVEEDVSLSVVDDHYRKRCTFEWEKRACPRGNQEYSFADSSDVQFLLFFHHANSMDWIIDSGASRHMAHGGEVFSEFYSCIDLDSSQHRVEGIERAPFVWRKGLALSTLTRSCRFPEFLKVWCQSLRRERRDSTNCQKLSFSLTHSYIQSFFEVFGLNGK